MFPPIFTDELGMDITKGLPIIKSWGLEYVELRGRVFGKAAEALPAERLDELKTLLDMFAPLVERARAAGLVLTFENCGVTPDAAGPSLR